MPAVTISSHSRAHHLAEPARAALRSALAAHFHAQPVAAPAGLPSWVPPSSLLVASAHQALPPELPVPGDPVVLMENLKILRQYAKLLTQACHHHRSGDLAAHVQPLSPAPTSFQRNLEWFAPLARPYAGISETASARVAQMLQLYQATTRDQPLSTPELAFRLAKSLPHYDRDLTAHYLPPPEREIDLCVAHSVLRLHDPPDPEALQRALATWRNQGLLHVLSVAAMHMPELQDWFPAPDTPSEDKDGDACSLLLTLDALRSNPRDHARTIEDFIHTQDPATRTAQAIATTLDRLAILMSVRSDADTEPEHDLALALAAFPCLDALEPQDVWRRLKTALVRSIPPSLLRIDPVCARKRVRQAQGTW